MGLSHYYSAQSSLPVALSTGVLVVSTQPTNRLWFIGGLNQAAANVATVYSCLINSDGTLGPWVTSVALPTTTPASFTAFAVDNHLYVMGGLSSGVDSAVTYRAKINPDGTTQPWVAFCATPIAASWQGGVTFQYNNKVYAFGALSGSNYAPSVYKADVIRLGHIGPWTVVGDIQAPSGSNFGGVLSNDMFWYYAAIGSDLSYLNIENVPSSLNPIQPFKLAVKTSESADQPATYAESILFPNNGYGWLTGPYRINARKNQGQPVNYLHSNLNATIAFNGVMYSAGGFDGTNTVTTVVAKFIAPSTLL